MILRLNLYLATLFFFFSNTVSAQTGPVIEWQKCIGGTKDDNANDLIMLPDGGAIIVGNTYSNDGDMAGNVHGTASTDAWVARVNAQGAIVWQHSYGSTGNDNFVSVLQLTDSTFLCAGTAGANNGDVTGYHGGSDVWMVQINRNGNILSSHCYGGTNTDYPKNITKLDDGNIAVLALTASTDGDLSGIPPNSGSAWVFKMDVSYNIQWNKCYDGAPSDIVQKNNGEIMVAIHPGDTDGSGPFPDVAQGRNNIMLYLNAANGSQLRYQNASVFQYYSNGAFGKAPNALYYSSQCRQYPGCNVITSLTGPVSFGYIGSCSADMGGSVDDQKLISSPHGVHAFSDSAFIAAGSMYYQLNHVDAQYGGNDAFVVYAPYLNKTQRYYGGSGNDYFTSIKTYPSNDEFLAVGSTNSNNYDVSGNHGGYDIWLVKLKAGNTILGKVFVDANNNQQYDAGEKTFDKARVTTTKQGFNVASVPVKGFYANGVDTGNFVTSISVTHPYYSAGVNNIASSFTTYKNIDTVDFPVHPIPGIRDLSVALFSVSTPRPGFDINFGIKYNNNGTDTPVNKTVTYIKDPRLQLLQATPTPTNINGDTLRWSIASLEPDSSGIIHLTFNVPPIPTVNIGDTLNYSVSIDSTGDVTPADNYMQHHMAVMGSYDPNDKNEAHAGTVSMDELINGQYLTYTIRFQNTGTDTAFTIKVTDTLSVNSDWSSFEMVDASHPYNLHIKNGKVVTWIFNNIQLVDKNTNEPLSHGYIVFRIKPKLPVTYNQLANKADIYFDYNPAIVTNTHVTSIVSKAMWTGAVSNDWHNAANWSNNKIPDAFTDVFLINGAPRYPVIAANAVCRSLHSQVGASVTVNTGVQLKIEH